MAKSTKAKKEVQDILNSYDLNCIKLKVELHPNDYDKKVPHLVAYNPTDLIVEVEERDYRDGSKNKLVFSKGQSCKYEELNKYFSAKLFAIGITQRADYIKAPLWVKEWCYNNNVHPAQYRPGMIQGTLENA
jgi:hypothetical protein